VLGGGTLTAPTVRAARLEVSLGGLLQALLEKFVPAENSEEPEVEVKAESKAQAA
jgi:hypothetical protein